MTQNIASFWGSLPSGHIFYIQPIIKGLEIIPEATVHALSDFFFFWGKKRTVL